MADMQEYSRIFREIEKLSPEDTLQIILESNSEDEKEFYEMVGDYLLQKKQKLVMERNPF